MRFKSYASSIILLISNDRELSQGSSLVRTVVVGSG